MLLASKHLLIRFAALLQHPMLLLPVPPLSALAHCFCGHTLTPFPTRPLPHTLHAPHLVHTPQVPAHRAEEGGAVQARGGGDTVWGEVCGEGAPGQEGLRSPVESGVYAAYAAPGNIM
jgi:hypothetical protein